MATTHMNLPQLPSGAVDGISQFNNAMNIIEAGRTFKITVGAGTTMVKTSPFYISTADKLAYKSNSTTEQFGLWQSSSNTSATEGYGQVDGYMYSTLWNWGYGALIYVSTASTLTTAQPRPNQQPIALAISSREVWINPPRHHDAFGISNFTEVTVAVSSGETTGQSATNTNLIGGQIMGWYPTTSDKGIAAMSLDSSGSVNITLQSSGSEQNGFKVIVLRTT